MFQKIHITIEHLSIGSASFDPGLLQTVGIAMLTLLVPLAIAIFTGVLSREKDDSNAVLDMHALFDYVIDVKKLLLSIVAIFATPLLWKFNIPFIKTVIVIIWLAGLFFLLRALKNLYKWTKGDKDTFRAEYFEQLGDLEGLTNVSRDIWNSSTLSRSQKHAYIKEFVKKIDELLDTENKEEVRVASDLLTDFRANLEKGFMDTLDRKSLGDIFALHYKAWHISYTLLVMEDNDTTLWGEYSQCESQLGDILHTLLENWLLKPNYLLAYTFFSTFKKHVDKYSEESIVNPNSNVHYYIESFFFFTKLFEASGKQGLNYQIWHGAFPEEWKLTPEKIKNPTFIINKLLREFTRWAIEGLSRHNDNPNDETNRALDLVIRNLFPNSESNNVAYVIHYVFGLFDSKNLDDFIKSDEGYGLFTMAKDEYDTIPVIIALSEIHNMFANFVKEAPELLKQLAELDKQDKLNKKRRARIARLRNILTQIIEYKDGSK